MLILALDTTTRAGSIALARDRLLLAVTTGDAGRTHAERLPADLLSLLDGQSVGIGEVDAFAVAAGPGSFTGLRIGIATVQGLAFGLGRPVVGVSVLDALGLTAARAAAAADQSEALAGAFMDAQRHEVFGALYPSGRSAPPFDVLDGPVSEPPAPLLARWRRLAGGRSIWLAGDATDRYRELLEREATACSVVAPLPPLAPVIAEVAFSEILAGRAVSPHAVRPVYVRRPDAELAREKSDEVPGQCS